MRKEGVISGFYGIAYLIITPNNRRKLKYYWGPNMTLVMSAHSKMIVVGVWPNKFGGGGGGLTGLSSHLGGRRGWEREGICLLLHKVREPKVLMFPKSHLQRSMNISYVYTCMLYLFEWKPHPD